LGSGHLKDDLKQQARGLDIEDRVIFLGSITNVDEWLARASIFAFPSISEGFPNALAEAMAAGLPVVSFNCDAGPNEIVVNGLNGFLVPVGNVDMLTDYMKRLVNDPSLRDFLGRNAQDIQAMLDTKTIASEYLDFFQNHENIN